MLCFIYIFIEYKDIFMVIGIDWWREFKIRVGNVYYLVCDISKVIYEFF